ncbi:MAG TPA: hypothetical protein VMU51_33915 [Mycobacteriales bacterium]|nr:hypothetical protein [Mycobacteriales bacterium]
MRTVTVNCDRLAPPDPPLDTVPDVVPDVVPVAVAGPPLSQARAGPSRASTGEAPAG